MFQDHSTLATMKTNSVIFVAIFILTISSLNSSSKAVTFRASSNLPPTSKFATQVGLDYTRQIMREASDFIWATFQQSEPERKNLAEVTLTIESMNGIPYPAYTLNNGIHVKAGYLEGYKGDLKFEFTGVLVHEMTHVWQWNGNGRAPSWLIEGVADYVRLKTGYVPGHWVKAGEGDRWDQGYDVTAHFLDYCDSYRRKGFVAELNKKMKDGYSDGFFVELLGKSVDQLWAEYKAMYRQ